MFARTARVLTEVMNMRRVRDYVAPDANARAHVFAMGEGGPAAELHVIEGRELPHARQGAGGVHHVAFRTPDEEQYHAWTARLNELRLRKAAELLARSETRRISDVAFDCGFNDLSYFNRCFRRRFGLTPTAARGP